MVIEKFVERVVVTVDLGVQVVGKFRVDFLEDNLRVAILAPRHRLDLVPEFVLDIELETGMVLQHLCDANAVEEGLITFTGLAGHFFVTSTGLACDSRKPIVTITSIASLAWEFSRTSATAACGKNLSPSIA